MTTVYRENKDSNNVIDTYQSLLAKKQCSHLLIALSSPVGGHGKKFSDWYKDSLLKLVIKMDHVVSAQHFKRHEIDITMGNYPPPDFRYLGVYELSLDGAEEAEPVIKKIMNFHNDQDFSGPPVTWIYYPVSEKVGNLSCSSDSLLTVAFANGLAGAEKEFREWYCTRHIRHALYFPGIVSGQCFEVTGFQLTVESHQMYQMIALYEQEGTPQEFLKYCENIPDKVAELISFPTLDLSCFGESVYKPISNKIYSSSEFIN